MARMRYRLRVLHLIGAVISVGLACLIWNSLPPSPNGPHSPEAKKATAELRDLLMSATSLEILDAGDAVPPRAKSVRGATLERLAQAATIQEAEKTTGSLMVVENANIRFRLMKSDEVLQEYWFLYHNILIDNSHTRDADKPYTILYMTPKFADTFLRELTTMEIR